MDVLLKQKLINQFSEKIKAVENNVIGLDKLECVQRKKFLEGQKEQAGEVQLKIYEDRVDYEGQCTKLVLRAVEKFEEMQYSQASSLEVTGSEANVRVELAPTGGEEKTKVDEPKNVGQ